MKIITAKKAGYCYGVERALKLVERELKKNNKQIYTLGPLIHNPQVVKELEGKGVKSLLSIDKVKKGTVIIRSHGVDPQTLKKAKEKGLNIIDATCPFVKKAQKCVQRLAREKYDVFIIGEKDHPEVKGLYAYSDNRGTIIENVEDVKKIDKNLRKIGLVVQTTQTVWKLQEIVKILLTRTFEIKIFNTICHATFERQKEAKKLAKKVDVMIVVGGKNSANTKRLLQICKESNKNSFHIESEKDLKKSWFKKDSSVGVTAGASTPIRITEKVVERINKLYE
ncbi:MAG: 4-hydroxy-3-methylbut-2-enyl diphosphate reductase [Actinomycetia bacterium]|nr:4-hydroxy-3-methylbut-2-enyl diphosphate reductase [Actinomycetes bacterium]